jgi:hypothetical protein
MGYTIWPDGATGDVLAQVHQERLRQEQLKREGAFPHTCADDALTNFEKLAILGEEVGEVGEARLALLIKKFGDASQATMQTTGINTVRDKVRDLRKELIQVAAVAVAWAESLQVVVPPESRCTGVTVKLPPLSKHAQECTELACERCVDEKMAKGYYP